MKRGLVPDTGPSVPHTGPSVRGGSNFSVTAQVIIS